MAEKSKHFRDYLRHSTGPESGTKHTKYPIGTGAGPNRSQSPGRPDDYSVKEQHIDPIKRAKGLPIEES